MSAETERQLQEWGNRLFFGMPKKPKKGARDVPVRLTGAAVRAHVRAAVAPNASQVMVKITGGGRGLAPIAAHFRYISRQGKEEVGGKDKTLELEDEQGNKLSGAQAMKDLKFDWQMAGTYIPETSTRREAFNIILSMPAGTPTEIVRDAARDFAAETFKGHRYVFVLHEDTASPHVHLAVRAERSDGVRLNPRKSDLRAWRQRFADRLQDRGIAAVATRAASRGQAKAPQAIWRLKTAVPIRQPRPADRSSSSVARGREQALEAWTKLGEALSRSDAGDRELAAEVSKFVERQFAQRSHSGALALRPREPKRGPTAP